MQVQAYGAQYGLPLDLGDADESVRARTTTSTRTSSHVLPALIRRFHEARSYGRPEVVVVGHRYAAPRVPARRRPGRRVPASCSSTTTTPEPINVGVGEDVTIRELAELVAGVVGYTGAISYDPTKPDGTPRKLLDVSRLLALGWKPSIDLYDGVAATYAWYQEQAL